MGLKVWIELVVSLIIGVIGLISTMGVSLYNYYTHDSTSFYSISVVLYPVMLCFIIIHLRMGN